jgi:hypothetical protein
MLDALSAVLAFGEKTQTIGELAQWARKKQKRPPPKRGTGGQTMYDELVKTLHHCVATMNCATCPVESIDKEAKAQQRCVTLLLAQAADAIEKLSKPRWIPVTERLPGREWVLCKCRVNIHEVLSLRDGYWYHDPQHQYMSGFVTHWMPLPSTEGLNET